MFPITLTNSGVVEAEEIEESGQELGDFVPAWVEEEGVEDNDGEKELLQFDPIDDNDEEPVANFDNIAWEGDHEYFFSEASEFMDPERFVQDVEINGTSTPYSILRKFMTDEVIREIIHQTNLYAVQRKIPQWKHLTVAEFWNFLALHVLTGIVQKPSLKDYWSINMLISTHYFGDTMSRNRFLQILRGLHFVNIEDPDLDTTNRFHKLGTILPDIVNNFRRAVNPGEFLTLDEELMPFRGRLSFRQYNPKKRGRFGIESFLLMDAEKKYVLDILPYQGRSTPIFDQAWIAAYGFGGATALTLLRKGYFNKNHRLVLDNYFQSPTLAKVLVRLEVFVLGTVRKNRKFMPRFVDPITKKPNKITQGEVETFSDGDMLLERWGDRREVFMLNTFIDHRMEECNSGNPANQRLKPASVLVYNKVMGAVDNMDAMIRPYQALRKTTKWYRKYYFKQSGSEEFFRTATKTKERKVVKPGTLSSVNSRRQWKNQAVKL
ncbi:piggyBac transposable element-derived protein 4 [Folsomia candida]|uniref:PiggyBac transposable element-derived protein 4 n=1 Tax=Folsomia candida TaxID=158441 RepID=A0A226DL73_FOLCA|nr:piggyBac transposable element-derived protein 4 [Folsomia candida]OXA45417.1 PiggyBac transposable element-derived protein 4 [Folsomia candida]